MQLASFSNKRLQTLNLFIIYSANSVATKHNLVILSKFGGDRNEREHVRGLAVLNDNVYLIRDQATYIEVYRYRSGKYEKLNKIRVNGFSKVRYMAACSLNQHIYVSDEDNNTIHTVQFNKQEEISNEFTYVGSFHVDQEPEGLSVTKTGNIVITFQKIRQLGIYDMFGTLTKYIHLSSLISHPWYAVEINNDEYLVSHDAGGESQISQVKVYYGGRSNVSVTYKDPLWQSSRSFARTEDGFIFLADFMQNTIFLLDPNFNFVKIIASELHGPTRLCYDEKGHHLYVTNHSTKDVYVFKYDSA